MYSVHIYSEIEGKSIQKNEAYKSLRRKFIREYAVFDLQIKFQSLKFVLAHAPVAFLFRLNSNNILLYVDGMFVVYRETQEEREISWETIVWVTTITTIYEYSRAMELWKYSRSTKLKYHIATESCRGTCIFFYETRRASHDV